MDATSRPRRRVHSVALLATLVMGAGLVPIAALADDHLEVLPEPVELLDAEILDDTDAAESDEPAPTTPTAPTTPAAGCPDLLAVASPAGVDGNELAVAITAQAIDTDLPGWSNVAWKPAQGTTLREVIVTGTDGTLTSLTDGTDNALDVTTLTFCGTVAVLPPAPTIASCDDLLAVAFPEGVEGDANAVSITAQAIDRDLPGWSNVAWKPAQGTTLREVIVTGTDGTLTSLTDGTDNALDVATLTFCGTVDRSANGGGGSGATPPGTPAVTVVTPPNSPSPTTPGTDGTTNTDSTTNGTTNGASGTTGTGGTTSTGSTTSTPAATDEADPEVPGVVTVEPPEAPDGDATVADAPEPEPEEEAEVLGIQLVQEDEAGGRGPLGAGVALLAGLALLASAGGVLWSRRS
jgi:hypothetical protein